MFHGVIHKITLAQFFLRHGVYDILWVPHWNRHSNGFRYFKADNVDFDQGVVDFSASIATDDGIEQKVVSFINNDLQF